GSELPEVVQCARALRGGEALAAEQPEIAAAIHPCEAGGTRAGRIADRAQALRAVGAEVGTGLRAAHPEPLPRGDLVLPQVPQRPLRARDIVTVAAEQPQVATGITVHAGRSARARQRHIGGAPRAIDTGCIDRLPTALPGPLHRARRECPQVIEQAAAADGAVALPTEQPEITGAVDEATGLCAAARHIGGSRSA